MDGGVDDDEIWGRILSQGYEVTEVILVKDRRREPLNIWLSGLI